MSPDAICVECLCNQTYTHTHVLHVGVVSIVTSFFRGLFESLESGISHRLQLHQKNDVKRFKVPPCSCDTVCVEVRLIKNKKSGGRRTSRKKTAKRSSEPLAQGRYLVHQRDHLRWPRLKASGRRYDPKHTICYNYQNRATSRIVQSGEHEPKRG